MKKIRQNAENKQTYDLMGKNEIEEKVRQSAGDKQTFDFLRGKIDIERKTRQNAENKQTFDLTRKLKLSEKLVKTLKIYKLLV